jgi:hypothetical protein
MGKIIGIDLGTTYCAVTIPESRAGQDGFMVIPECPSVSVILDSLKRHITPSVVAEDDRGEVLVGYGAKNRAGFSPAPIMFAKRSMGEAATFQLKRLGALAPEVVSAHILRYLKGMAESRLKDTVDAAVITVPAYFSMKAKEMTERAAEIAGLKVAQIAQEPVAAALMYTAQDPRPDLTILTYDLGGGTFDIAILEKRQGVLTDNSVKAFDGDRFLGGYNFDTALALWIGEQLCAQGFDLHLDLQNEGDKVIFAKFMVYAERAKISLSKEEVYEFQEPATGIVDHSGQPVSLAFVVTRAEFEGMIAKDIERSIELCRRALQKAYPDPKLSDTDRKKKIDEIVMVGGSSRIPLVGRRLAEEFGRAPRLVNPDLCVALGAGLIAKQAGDPAPTEVAAGRLTLGNIPAEAALSELVVTGQWNPSGGQKATGSTVTLGSQDGAYLKVLPLDETGKFIFVNVPLAEEAQTDFALTVRSAAGTGLCLRTFSVKHRSDAAIAVPPPTNILAKPISILLSDGLHVVAPERTTLPFETVVPAKTRDTSGSIRIEIYEENNPLGQILMTDIPATLAVGSTVEITLTIQQNYQIRGRGYVPALAREETVVIDIPVRAAKTLAELQRGFEELKGRVEEALVSAGRGARFAGGKVNQVSAALNRCEEMLLGARKGQPFEPAAIQDCMDEIENLLRGLKPWEAKPGRDVFEETVQKARQTLETAITKGKAKASDHHDKQIDAISAEANKAFETQNQAAWADQYQKICGKLENLEHLIVNGGDPPEIPVASLLLECAKALESLRVWAKAQNRLDQAKTRFDQQAAELKKIDPNSPNARPDISDWYNKFLDLAHSLENPDTEGILELDKKRLTTHN